MVLGLASPAPGQGASLPQDLPAKSELAPADITAIGAFIEGRISDLRAADLEASKKAREALFRPIEGGGVSVAFRLEYAKQLEPKLTSLAEGADGRLAAVALRLAGKLATATSERTLQRGLASKTPSTRFAAAVGYQELLRAVAGGALGLGDAAVDKSMDTLKGALGRESDPRVAEGLVLALRGAIAAPPGASSPGQSALAMRAVQRLCEGGTAMVKRLRAGGAAGVGADAAAWAAAIERGLDAAYQAMLAQLQAGGGAISPAFIREAGVFSGTSLAYARDRLRAVPPASADARPELDALAVTVGTAENLLILAANQANPADKAVGKNLKGAFEQAIQRGDAAWFAKAAESYLAAGGLVTKAPFSVKADDLR